MRLLIVDDEVNIVNVLKEYAIHNDYEVEVAYDGVQAIDKVEEGNFDLILMDIMMPNMNGDEAVRAIKAIKNIPVIMISAKAEEYDKLVGFELGIDDYIVKPFSPKEVMARIKAVIKRNSAHGEKIGDFTIDILSRTVKKGDKEINLNNKEFELFVTLVKNKGIVMTREKLLNEVWGYDYRGEDRTVDAHIKMLRNHLGDKEIIKTIRGMGYKIEK